MRNLIASVTLTAFCGILTPAFAQGARPSDQDVIVAIAAILRADHNTPDLKVISFARLNGIDRGVNYQVMFEAVVEFPSGANLDCAPLPSGTLDTRPCMQRGKAYAAVGAKLKYNDSFMFVKSERGWMTSYKTLVPQRQVAALPPPAAAPKRLFADAELNAFFAKTTDSCAKRACDFMVGAEKFRLTFLDDHPGFYVVHRFTKECDPRDCQMAVLKRGANGMVRVLEGHGLRPGMIDMAIEKHGR